MALMDRFRKKSTNSVNHVEGFGAVNFFSQYTSRKKYSDMYLWMIACRIFRGLQNVRFELRPEFVTAKTEAALAPLIKYLNTNLNVLVWHLWQDGMIVLEEDRPGRWFCVPFDKLKFDAKGEVIGHKYVIYSESYIFLGKSDIAVVRENLNALDVYKNSDIYLTKTFGAFGILSGQSMGINAADKEALQEQLKMRAGTTEAKDQFLITGSALDFHQIDFKIRELQLPEKVREEVMAVAGYFGVPYDLLPMSGKSTYANQEQAVVDFYRNCIMPLSEVVLSLGQYIILKKYKDIPTAVLTFTLDNVAELKDDGTAAVEYKTKVVELGQKIVDLGLDLPEYIKKELEENQ